MQTDCTETYEWDTNSHKLATNSPKCNIQIAMRLHHVGCFMSMYSIILKVQLWKRFHIFFLMLWIRFGNHSNMLSETSICVALCKNASPMKNSWDFHGRNVTMAAFFSRLHSIYCLCSGSRHWSLLIWLKVDCLFHIDSLVLWVCVRCLAVGHCLFSGSSALNSLDIGNLVSRGFSKLEDFTWLVFTS